MTCRRTFAPFLLAFAALAAAAADAEAGEIRIYTPASAFIVSVAPVDIESRDAESSVLYLRVGDEKEWSRLGECEKTTLPNGDVRFTREVNVEEDGIYHFTSRPVVGGLVASPPGPESPVQATVVVDTVAPKVEIVAPAEGFTSEPDKTARISWTSSDENPADSPVALSYTTDGGKSWNLIARDLPAEGDFDWLIPEFLAGPVTIRAAASDRAGNIGRAMRSVEVETPPPPIPVTPPALPPLPTPPRPAETILDRPAVVPPPEPEAKEPEITPEPEKIEKPVSGTRDANRSWLYYLMAINLMRQNKPADALYYYWLSVKEDPDFIDAWADIGLAYVDLGAYRTARDIVERTRDKAPERIDLMHLLGETYHAEGMELLQSARTNEERMRAKGLIDQAVEWYGTALEKAAEEWRLAEQAPSFYRLGEICYFVNMDSDGARAYWRKILELHSPTPNSDLILWSPESERDKARLRHQRHTHMRVSLVTWQNWARGYLEQMDARERAGILDLMPAQRITAIPGPIPLAHAGNALNPGRDDGRSLFSLPAQLGDASATVAAEACSTPEPSRTTGAFPATPPANPAGSYNFYAPKNDRGTGNPPAAPAPARSRRSVFSGGPDRPPPPNQDPYVFPRDARTPPGWNGFGPYGSRPGDDW